MSSVATNSWIASNRSQSITWRCTSGSDTRRRSGRGGNRPAWSSTPAPLLPLVPLPPDQEAGGQHHADRRPRGPRPQPALGPGPAQQTRGLLVRALHPVPPVCRLDQLGQRRLRHEGAPRRLRLTGRTAARPRADQPALPTPARRRHPPAAHRREPSSGSEVLGA